MKPPTFIPTADASGDRASGAGSELPPAHAFVRAVHLAIVPGPSTPLADSVLDGLRDAFRARGDRWTPEADERTDAFVTTARMKEPIPWRDAPLFSGRRAWGLAHTPVAYAVVAVERDELRRLLAQFERALRDGTEVPHDLALAGLAPAAWSVLREQGSRGGPMMCVARLLQAQAKSVRVVMAVGDERPEEAYLFDLAGAHPRIGGANERRFYDELALRIATQLSSREAIRDFELGEPIARRTWSASAVPDAMRRASRQLGQRDFFTRMVRIADLVEVPFVTDAVAQQYSEGCFGTYDPALEAQIVTVTGSLRPVEKSALEEADLAVVASEPASGEKLRVRPIEGLRNETPSTEALEFVGIDASLPWVALPLAIGSPRRAPVVRSKLHGHRGIRSFDPRRAEYVALDRPFHDYPVSCSTEAQSRGIAEAFARASCLRHPTDERTIAFTVVPGHGLLLVEKWVAGTAPFEVILRAMDEGVVEIEHHVPQGRFDYAPRGERMVLVETAGRPSAIQSR